MKDLDGEAVVGGVHETLSASSTSMASRSGGGGVHKLFSRRIMSVTFRMMIFMKHSDRHPPEKSKKNALVRGQESRGMLSVEDDAHLALMRSASFVLVCPEPGCDVTFTKPYGPNKNGTRSLANTRGKSCDHVFDPPVQPPIIKRVGGGGGGPIAAQHLWFQHRLVRVCEVLGYEAVLEHSPTFADVYVHQAKYCLEVQRWPTNFLLRTEARLAKGAHVLWMLTEDADASGVMRALSEQPAVRLRAVSRKRGNSLQPWNEEGQNADAMLVVSETVAGTRRLLNGSFERSSMDAAQFLKEVFEGRRVWIPPRKARFGHESSGGIWVLKSQASAERPSESAADVTETDQANPEAAATANLLPPNASIEESTPTEEHVQTPLESSSNDQDARAATRVPRHPSPQLSWWRRIMRWLVEE